MHKARNIGFLSGSLASFYLEKNGAMQDLGWYNTGVG